MSDVHVAKRGQMGLVDNAVPNSITATVLERQRQMRSDAPARGPLEYPTGSSTDFVEVVVVVGRGAIAEGGIRGVDGGENVRHSDDGARKIICTPNNPTNSISSRS